MPRGTGGSPPAPPQISSSPRSTPSWMVITCCGPARKNNPSAKVVAQRARIAARSFSTVRFSDSHQQRVILIEQGGVRRQVVHEEALDLPIARSVSNQAVPLKHSTGVRVHYKDRPVAGIEQDRVGSLLPDPRDRKPFLPQFR